MVVPNLVNDVVEELGDATFGCFVAGLVIKVGSVGSLGTNRDNGPSVVGNVSVIEGEAGRPDELGASMVGFILGRLHEDGHEGIDS